MNLRSEPKTETLVYIIGLSHCVQHLLAELQAEVTVLQQQPPASSHGLSQQAASMGLLPLTHGDKSDL